METLKSLVINYPRVFFHMTPTPHPVQKSSSWHKTMSMSFGSNSRSSKTKGLSFQVSSASPLTPVSTADEYAVQMCQCDVV